MTTRELTAAGRQIRRPGADTSVAAAWEAAAAVLDPEVPVLTIADLGVLRQVEQRADGTVVATVTPTYSG